MSGYEAAIRALLNSEMISSGYIIQSAALLHILIITIKETVQHRA